MELLELFSWLGSIGKVAKKHWINVTSLDINSKFEPDLCMDIMDFKYGVHYSKIPDVIWASPDCTSFSIAAAWYHRDTKNNYFPKTLIAHKWDLMIHKLINIIAFYKIFNPNLIYFIENPRWMLQKMDYMKWFEPYKQCITYCQYWDTRMKPTNIWTNSSWHWKPMCKRWDSCHESSPRCSHTWWTVALKNKELRSIIPEWLCEDIIQFIINNPIKWKNQNAVMKK